MSITYTPTTNFGAKDSLPANDPAKVIKGAEFTTEYTAIQSAFALAAPASNPTFTGSATFDDVSITNGLTVDGTTLVVDDTNNTVGIGTATPTLGSGTGLAIYSSSVSRVQLKNSTTGDASTNGAGLALSGSDLYVENREVADVITFIDGTEIMRTTSTGNVGIGDATPSVPLSVIGTARAGRSTSQYLEISGDVSSNRLAAIGTTKPFVIENESDSNLQIRTATAQDILLRNNGTTTLTATGDNNVGIGTTAPATKLEVSRLGANWTGVAPAPGTSVFAHPGSTNVNSGVVLTLAGNASATSAINFSSDTDNDVAAISHSNSDDYMRFRVGGSERVAISETGNVGIGDTAPAYRLDVQTPAFNVARFTSSGASTGMNLGTLSGAANIQYYDSGERLVLKTPGRLQYTVGDGTSPAYHYWTNSDDANTDSSDEQMRLTNNGALGIGTTSPDANSRLHVAATATNGLSGSGLIKVQNTVANAATISFDNPTNDWTIGTDSNADFNLYNVTGATTPFLVQSGAPSGSLRVSSTGNVGIGQTAPTAKFEVKSIATAGGEIARFDDSGSGITGRLKIGTTGGSGTDSVRLDSINRNLDLGVNGTTRVTVYNTGQMRLIPMASAPSGAGAGDLYFDSTTNKLRCYDGTTWQDCF